MSDKCEHAEEFIHADGRELVKCGKFSRNNSYGVCHTCADNTTKGEWPKSAGFVPTAAVTIRSNNPMIGPPQPPPPEPVPVDKWPSWANWVSGQKADPDKGVGDTVKRKLGIGGKIFQASMKLIGVPCGCNARKAEWNIKYPYGEPTP